MESVKCAPSVRKTTGVDVVHTKTPVPETHTREPKKGNP